MKKTLPIIVALALLTSFTAPAQGQNHICFKKTPVTGTTEQFFSKLIEKGFRKVPGYKAVSGEFAGCNATVYTDTTLVSGTVWKVNANLDAKKDWKSVKGDYILFKNYLSVKYGKPSNCYESFSGAYHEGDNMEMKALTNKKCNYVSNWNTDNGNISISIVPQKNNSACLLISYEDVEGLKLYAKEQTSIFLEDL